MQAVARLVVPLRHGTRRRSDRAASEASHQPIRSRSVGVHPLGAVMATGSVPFSSSHMRPVENGFARLSITSSTMAVAAPVPLTNEKARRPVVCVPWVVSMSQVPGSAAPSSHVLALSAEPIACTRIHRLAADDPTAAWSNSGN